MEQKYHSEVEKHFVEYLITIGYPKDCIVYEPAFLAHDGRKTYRPDFLIVDPIKKERLALIEIKGNISLNLDRAYEQLLAYSKAIGSANIPLFLVTPSETPNGMFPFDLYVFDKEGGLIKSDFALFPTFPALTAEESAERKSELRVKKGQVIESFQSVSWVLSAILLFIVIADFICSQYKIILLTTERMALIGAAVALIVIPFAQKFKGLGIEWEREKKEK